jgi:hypothetical protein
MIEMSGRQTEFYNKQWMYPHLDNFYFDNAGEEDPTVGAMREMPLDLEDADMLGMHLDPGEMPPTIQ